MKVHTKSDRNVKVAITEESNAGDREELEFLTPGAVHICGLRLSTKG